MKIPIKKLKEKIETNKQRFSDAGLNGNFFIDIYRSQPLEPELYELYPLPAIFIDYTMQGSGLKQPRLVTLTLHIVTDNTAEISNISQFYEEGLQRFMYNSLIQEILEGCRLGKTTPLRFIAEAPVDTEVVNYHTQTYEFDMRLHDMMEDRLPMEADLDSLNIDSMLKNKL